MRNGDMSQNPYVRPGDVITVNRYERRVTVKGAVERPGTYELLKNEILKDLVNFYGKGLAPMADTSRIELTRYTNRDAEKATLTIGAANALPVTNALTGSNVKVALETTTGSGESATVTDHRADYLVFGTNAGNVGFYKPVAALTTIAANKAFIAASSLTTGAGAIALNFGGNTTGINNAVVASENAPIFDLSGRRVVKAVKGGVYIQNGKKFVK